MPSLLVVGTGLMGTSIGLAATAAGYDVRLDELDAHRLAMAEAVGAGHRWAPGERVDLAVVATTPAAVAPMIARLLHDDAAGVVTHVCSVQSKPEDDLESLDGLDGRFCGSHPVAGGERSGPGTATSTLFEGRPWLVCPTPVSTPSSVATVARLAADCGADVVEMSAAEHDRLLAVLSHLPQLVASALAATLTGLPDPQVALAGTGVRDTTRLADSSPGLWAEIVSANPAAVTSALQAFLSPLLELRDTLATADPTAVTAAVSQLVADGQAGRGRLTGKHGQQPVVWATVSVGVRDRAGQLAQLLADAATTGVNVEDIRVDHAPGAPTGIVELSVSPDGADRLHRGLSSRGWTATTTGAADPRT
jgi:prephenate dehydrogenase